MGAHHVKGKPRPKARGRRPRPRICLRKGCKRKYHPRSWNQRYCQQPECRRQIRRWQAARRQARRRQDAEVRTRAPRQRRSAVNESKLVSQPVEDAEVTPGVVTQLSFFPLLYAIGQDVTNHP